MERFCIGLIIAFGCELSCDQVFADTTIYLVRHAEKTRDREPILNEAGKQRARDLARVLRSVNLTACFATQFKRTQLTIGPTADSNGLDVRPYQAGKEAELVKWIRNSLINNSSINQSILIAGHSNTVPDLLKLLGAKDPPILDEDDYDDLFVIRLNGDGKAVFIERLHYGNKNPLLAPVKNNKNCP